MKSSSLIFLFFSKLTNILLVSFSYLVSNIFRRPIMFGLPITLSIEPVNFCNLSCPECPVGKGSLTRKAGQMQLGLFSNIIKKIASHTSYLTLYFQGEPLLHPDFIEFLKIAKQNKIYTASSTNAQMLNDEMAKKIVESGLHKLIISVDGTTQEVYEKYRVGGSLIIAKEGIKALIAWKKKIKSNTPYVELQFLVLKHNEHQLPEIKKLAKEFGVNKLSLKTAQIIDFEKGSDLIPTQKKYARYQKTIDGTFRRKKQIHNCCWRAFSGAVITVDGDVLPCSYDKNGEFVFGNINEQTLAEIWHNEKARKFRQQILTDRKLFGICRNCTE